MDFTKIQMKDVWCDVIHVHELEEKKIIPQWCFIHNFISLWICVYYKNESLYRWYVYQANTEEESANLGYTLKDSVSLMNVSVLPV